MDVQQALAQATAVATAVSFGVPTAQQPAQVPPELGYVITALGGGLVSLAVNKLVYGWQRRDAYQIESDRIRRDEKEAHDQALRDWRESIEQKQQQIEHEFNEKISAINLALLRVERSISEIDGYIEPIRAAVRQNIRRKLQDDVPGS